MVDDAPMHRLWYDLRSQALFEASFREDVLEIDEQLEQMIWQVVARYAELRGVDGLDAVIAGLRDVRRPLPAGAAAAHRGGGRRVRRAARGRAAVPRLTA